MGSLPRLLSRGDEAPQKRQRRAWREEAAAEVSEVVATVEGKRALRLPEFQRLDVQAQRLAVGTFMYHSHSLLDPNSDGVLLWQMCILASTVATSLATPYEVGFLANRDLDDPAMHHTNTVLTVIFTIDMIVTFRTFVEYYCHRKAKFVRLTTSWPDQPLKTPRCGILLVTFVLNYMILHVKFYCNDMERAKQSESSRQTRLIAEWREETKPNPATSVGQGRGQVLFSAVVPPRFLEHLAVRPQECEYTSSVLFTSPFALTCFVARGGQQERDWKPNTPGTRV